MNELYEVRREPIQRQLFGMDRLNRLFREKRAHDIYTTTDGDKARLSPMRLEGVDRWMRGQQGPVGGPAQPELPEEAGSSFQHSSIKAKLFLGHGDWNAPEYTDTTDSKEKKVTKELSFYKMETDKVSERYIAPCFVNSLDAYDGEINLALDQNLISNKYAVKLCLDYEVKKGNKVVKKELIVALKEELYFVKFTINPKEHDVEPEVIFRRSFMRLVNGIVDFGSELGGDELSPFVCKMGNSSCNKKRAMDNLNLFYPDIRPSSSIGKHLTQGEAAKEAFALRISQKFALLEEVRPVLETMAYNDKYKKVLDEIWKEKVELDGMIAKE
ncbi:hypothetical protein Tco_0667808 [Tanacetum coccineum]